MKKKIQMTNNGQYSFNVPKNLVEMMEIKKGDEFQLVVDTKKKEFFYKKIK